MMISVLKECPAEGGLQIIMMINEKGNSINLYNRRNAEEPLDLLHSSKTMKALYSLI